MTLAVLVSALAFVSPSFARGTESKLYPKGTSPRTTAEWRDSADRMVSVCFSTAKTTFASGEDVVVRCWVRNNSDSVITVLHPFGDSNFALSAGIAINGPKGLVDYGGAAKEYVLGTADFMQLPARSIVEQSLVLSRNVFPEMKTPGLYTIGYLYQSGEYPRPEAPANLWQGQVQSPPTTILLAAKSLW